MPRLPKLTPITSPWMHELMADQALINQLFEKYGSPMNIHQTDSMEENFESYHQVFKEFGLKHQIFFARKANKTREVVKKAYSLGMGIDTASLQEFVQCLEMGTPAKDLIVTAAIKNRDLVKEAIKAGSLLVLDNEDECVLVQENAQSLNKKANIAFRISGFLVNGQKIYSRFGFDLEKLDSFIQTHFIESKSFDLLEYKGLHFHLNGYSAEERSMALQQSLEFAEHLSKIGWVTEFIDIGGGILMNYLQYESEWDYFNEQIRKAVSSEIDPITFGNQGLGLQMIDGKLQGDLSTYPFWNSLSKGDLLRKVLSYKTTSGESLAHWAKKLDIEIRMEPGRSMLDQVGMTVAKVAFRKKDSRGDWLVGLEMNMTQMLSGSADFLLDPFVVYQEEEGDSAPVEVYFTGAYCLERDVLLKRKVALKKLPKVGDTVVFVNTAGYMMHFFESNAHLFPLASNVVWNRSVENEQISLDQFFLED